MADPLDAPGTLTKTLRVAHGVTVAYSTLGRGERTVILANGLGGRLYAWGPLVDALAPDYRIITWDYRGLFDSTAPQRRRHLSVADHVDDAVAILDAEGVDRAAFCGWSMGVQVSLEAAVLYPARVAGLVLLNGTYGHAFSSGFQPFFRVPFMSGWAHAAVDFLLDHPPVGAVVGRIARLTAAPTMAAFSAMTGVPTRALGPSVNRYLREVFTEPTFANYLRLFQELDAHSVYHHLRDIEAPALVISGAYDVLTPAYQSREIAARLPNAEALHVVRGSHFVLLERPELVVPAVSHFLSARAQWAG